MLNSLNHFCSSSSNSIPDHLQDRRWRGRYSQHRRLHKWANDRPTWLPWLRPEVHPVGVLVNGSCNLEAFQNNTNLIFQISKMFNFRLSYCWSFAWPINFTFNELYWLEVVKLLENYSPYFNEHRSVFNIYFIFVPGTVSRASESSKPMNCCSQSQNFFDFFYLNSQFSCYLEMRQIYVFAILLFLYGHVG